jgi:hypothetical protein
VHPIHHSVIHFAPLGTLLYKILFGPAPLRHHRGFLAQLQTRTPPPFHPCKVASRSQQDESQCIVGRYTLHTLVSLRLLDARPSLPLDSRQSPPYQADFNIALY